MSTEAQAVAQQTYMMYVERNAFVAGAEWQASRPVTDAEVDALKVGDALLRETAEKQREHIARLVKQRDALAAQIEAALRLLAPGVRADPDRVAGILPAGSEVRARILAEHDARVLEEAADEFAVVPHPYEGGVTGWLRARAAEKREEADRG
ncbi:hypothetical protein [Agromyces larvae]|uniref:Uncharacterized protein n=1 Tax=Agromyces larvae TaxID=2929802 RepID=A0ABY4CB51_9MICO|nr:hypothetical protein [Agromyces larvae]UOE45925.1 hypothetical protein MTO99_09350 [Agromyces larvae]